DEIVLLCPTLTYLSRTSLFTFLETSSLFTPLLLFPNLATFSPWCAAILFFSFKPRHRHLQAQPCMSPPRSFSLATTLPQVS
ncbi:hypothetical protein Droror1_Dr00006529, partial [Drosera rotundifolia]